MMKNISEKDFKAVFTYYPWPPPSRLIMINPSIIHYAFLIFNFPSRSTSSVVWDRLAGSGSHRWAVSPTFAMKIQCASCMFTSKVPRETFRQISCKREQSQANLNYAECSRDCAKAKILNHVTCKAYLMANANCKHKYTSTPCNRKALGTAKN